MARRPLASYREAVIDGCLIDHEPPVSLVTNLAEHGIHWEKGAQLKLFDPRTQGIDLVNLEDEVDVEIESFNRTVITENFNRVICAELARQIDPTDLGKTLIFCAMDNHADMVVHLLKQKATPSGLARQDERRHCRQYQRLHPQSCPRRSI
ncbi:MAG TPA: hypothetical protein VIV60_25260 [Polyangiaceae bacterium]